MWITRIIYIFLALAGTGCITQFIPDVEETKEMLVVEGMLTDNDVNTVILSKSLPLDAKKSSSPLSGCTVWITDDANSRYNLSETAKGTYTMFGKGVVGRKYTLHINTNNSYQYRYTFQSYPVEMLPVPPVDTVYYEKVPVQQASPYENITGDNCQIYINAIDPSNKCKFFRWDFTETWEIRLPFAYALNKNCWVTEESQAINIKSTAGLSLAEIQHYPLHFITNRTDRLKVKYSMLINQYSLSEEEFLYWEKLKAMTQDIGGLYDVTPASIPNNIYCNENPSVKVLGYFSVSAKKSKRFFISDYFRQQPDLYYDCVHDTIFGNNPKIPDLNISVWILDYNTGSIPPYTTITYTRGCADCTVRGTNIKPLFWK